MLCLGFTLVLSACSTTKFLKEGEQFLTGNRIQFIDAKHVPNKRSLRYQLSTLYKQKENSNIFFIPREWFYYKTQDPGDTTKFDRWKLRVLGEEPAIYSEEATQATAESIQFYMNYRGYYNAAVRAQPIVSKNEKKIAVTYEVVPGDLFTIDSVLFNCPDPALDTILQQIRSETYLQPGDPLDRELYESEKDRILQYLRNHGYAQFYPNYFAPLEADTTVAPKKATLYFNVNTPFKDSTHRVYKIGKIDIYPQFNPNLSPEELQDTIINGYRFLFPRNEKKYWIKPQVVTNAIFLKTDDDYSQDNLERTNRQLSSLGVFKFVRINQEPDSLRPEYLNFRIELPASPRLQLGADFEINYTNRTSLNGTRGNLMGLSANPNVRNRNVLRGAELLLSNLSAGVEVNFDKNLDFWNTIDLGAQTDLYFPRFLDYLRLWHSSRKLLGRNPEKGLYPALREKAATRLSGSYNFVQLLDFYEYDLLNASFGYELQKDNYHRYIINHLGIDFLDVNKDRPNFQDILKANPFLDASFGDQLFVSLLFREFNYIYNSPITRFGESHYVGFNIETAGAEIWAANKIYNALADTSTIFQIGTPKGNDINFSQYVRFDLDLRYNREINEKTSYAARFNIGVARPFGNTKEVPYVKQFYVGGPYSIRAWAARGLGPGSYIDENIQNISNRLFFSQAGDLKLEANFEYRFNIFWLLDGALFLDAGNIWTIKADTSRCGSQFLFREKEVAACGDSFVNEPFYKQIALGGGFGFRFDFSYFILRVDAGIRLRNPAILEENNGYWTNFSKASFNEVVNFNLGLGYPF